MANKKELKAFTIGAVLLLVFQFRNFAHLNGLGKAALHINIADKDVSSEETSIHPSPVSVGVAANETNTKQQGNQLSVYHPSNAKLFSSIFVSCQLDPECRIMYHHVQKTGGSLVASRMHPIIAGESYNSKKWCFGKKMMNRFRNRTDYYCNLKLGIYEMNGPQFGEVVNTFRHIHSHGNMREVAFVTIREPIQRTLSHLHQVCNRGFKTDLTDKERKMCKACSYADHPQFFSRFVKDTNDMYTGIASAIPGILEQFRGLQSHLLILDRADIDSFFNDIQQISGITFPQGRSNTERKEICSFGMTSEMMRALKPAVEVYRNITKGVF